MRYTSIICAVLIAVLCFSIITLSFFTNDSSKSDKSVEAMCTIHSKIDPDIYTMEKTADGKYLAYIILTDISEDVIFENILSKTDYNPDYYESEFAYNTYILPSIISCTVENPDDITDYEQIEINKLVNIDYNNYIIAKRNIIRQLNTDHNQSFVNQFEINKKDILYFGKYTSSLIIYVDDLLLQDLINCDDVVSIMPFYNAKCVSHTFAVHSQIGTDSETGTCSNSFNFGEGYTGAYTKIGIIEASCGRYITTAAQLASIHSSGQLQYLDYTRSDGTHVTPANSDHATMVTSLVVGQSVTVSGRTYRGVVTDATVYQTCIENSSDSFDAIDALAQEGVSVINCSYGRDNNSKSYTNYDLEFDRIIKSTGITIVIAAGNFGETSPYAVTSPGKAYNAITVGSVNTKSSKYNVLSPVYNMRSSSSYAVDSFAANKPDVCAPGRYIAYVPSTSTVEAHSGTSYAAPLVTGIVAQIHQERPYLKLHPIMTKTYILLGSSNSLISTTGNSYAESGCNYLRKRSGAGFVNAVQSVTTAGQYYFGDAYINLNTITDGSIINMASCHFDVGDKVRIVFTYGKSDLSYPSATGAKNNFDLLLVDSNGTTIASSNNVYANIEIIEYTITSSDMYTLKLSVVEHVPTTTSVLVENLVAWKID